MIPKTKIIYFVTEDWYFCSHRLPLAKAAIKAGYDVSVVTRVRNHGEIIQGSGINLIPIELSRSGKNPFKEINVIWGIMQIYRREKPNIVHHVALKPVIYGSIAAYIAKLPNVINALAGMGFLFSSNKLSARLARPLVMIFFRVLLNRRNSKLILQNPDDVDLMLRENILEKTRISLIRGSGVNLIEYPIQNEPTGIPIVTLASRMLWDKGVKEFVEAARKLKKKGVKARFLLVGDVDNQNPSSISKQQLQNWNQEGVVEWIGHVGDMSSVFKESHVVCLPSYREGLPKVLLEAAACARPIVATDVPGCREIVQDGKNGLLVPLYDIEALASALYKLIRSPELCLKMGKYGRQIVEQNFSQKIVNNKTLSLYKDMLK